MSHIPLHLKTPCIESRTLSRHLGKPVWLKFEALQPPGSFKIRGIGLACQRYAERGARRFVSSSGGNAGIAVAYSGRILGIPVVVVLPETTGQRAIELIRQEDAEVIIEGSSWQEANTHALSILEPTDAMLHPFDDPLIWDGHASMVDEIAAQGVHPDAIVLSVGGGGLLCGVVQGLHRNAMASVAVVAMETRGADSFHQALLAGHPLEIPAITSIATSLGARRVCQQAYDWSASHEIHSAVVSDQSALNACSSFLKDHRLLVEPACGASLAAVYDGIEQVQNFSSLLVVVCGGVVIPTATA